MILAQMADDALNDYLIDHAYAQMMRARDDVARRRWCDRMTHYIKQRSSERVAEMEREKGLA